MTVKRGKLVCGGSSVKERGGKRIGKVSTGGRNNRGRRTVRHRGAGVKRARRRVESGQLLVLRSKANTTSSPSDVKQRIGRVRSVGYDPGRSGKVARRKERSLSDTSVVNKKVSVGKSEYVYVLAVEGREVGSVIQFSINNMWRVFTHSVLQGKHSASNTTGLSSQAQRLGSTIRRSERAVGTKVCNMSVKEGGVGKYRRSGGVHGELVGVGVTSKESVSDALATGVVAHGKKVASETKLVKQPHQVQRVQIRREGGKRREVPGGCTATVGVVASSFVRKKKAGTNRRLGWRPTVRGEAMNPVDHPHGGRTRGGRPEVTPWARRAKGKRTRKESN